MKFNKQAIIEKLKNTGRCKSEMKNLAEELIHLTKDEYDSLVHKLTKEYEGPALGNLLIVSAINKIKLAPRLYINNNQL